MNRVEILLLNSKIIYEINLKVCVIAQNIKFHPLSTDNDIYTLSISSDPPVLYYVAFLLVFEAPPMHQMIYN